jgi:hypothetical protein
MSYLKKFEAFHYSNLHRPNLIKIKVDELRDFCETYLAYLMDDAIKELKVGSPRLLQTDMSLFQNKYVCYNVEIYFNKSVHWDKIKDHFLPFLQILNSKVQKEYDFREDNIGRMCSIAWRVEDTSTTIPRQYNLEELLEDKIETNWAQAIGWKLVDILGNVGSIKLDILEEVEKN